VIQNETAMQLSLRDPTGANHLAVLSKRTYTVERGKLVLAAEQLPIRDDLVFDGEELLHDTDTIPLKLRTDVVIQGHAYGNGRSQFEAAVTVNGKLAKRILVLGDRECITDSGGSIFISPPLPVDKLPLRYTHAYGGSEVRTLDGVPEDRAANIRSLAVGLEVPPEQVILSSYPRNPAGCGWLLKPTLEAVGKLRLPNLEDPLDRLTPQRLAVGDELEWPKMPLPQSTGWMHYNAFPRRAYVGFAIPGKLATKRIAEVERGYYPENLLDTNKTYADTQLVAQGASPGLQFPHFRGGETIVLDNMHPKQARYTLTLPAERPKMWVDGRKGTLKETAPVIHTVVIEPDLDRVTILWRGSASALRPYLPAELAKMPWKVEWPSS